MKNQYLILIILSLLLFTNMSCDDDENNNNEEPTFTETNYIYEGDLRIYYLQTENNSLNESIEIWAQVPDNDPGYDEAQANIEIANAQIIINQTEILSIPNPSEAFSIKKPIIPPIPPTPSPCLCFEQYNSIRNIVFLPGTDQLNLSIRAYNDESEIVSTNNNSPIEIIPNTQNTGRYQPFQFEQTGFTGKATLSIQSDNQNYSILVNFQNLP